MSFREKNKSLIDTLSTLVLASLALIFSLRVFPMAMFLFPLPFIVLGVNYGWKSSLVGLVLGSVIVGLALDLYSGLIVLALFLPLTLSIVGMIRKEYEAGKILALASMVFFISILGLVFIASSSTGVRPVDKADQIFKINFERQLDLLKDTGLGGGDLSKLEESLDVVRENILVTLPSIFLILATAIAYLNYSWASWVLRKDGHELKNRPVFSSFKLPKNIFLGTLIMFALAYIFNKLNILNGEGLIRNLIVLVTFIFSIQGLSVLDYLMKKRGMKTFGRVTMVVLLVFLLPLGSLMSFVGVLDSLMDFRKLKRIK